MYYICNVNIIVEYYLALFSFFFLFIFSFFILFFFFFVFFFFSSERRHTRSLCDWIQTCALPILQAQLVSGAAELTRLREQLEMVTHDRDALQTDQIQWGLDRERMLGEVNRLGEHAAGLERDLGDRKSVV